MSLAFSEVEITSWKQLRDEIETFSPIKREINRFWIFRGQANSNWSLTTTIERQDLATKEQSIIDDFKRHSHLYSNTSKINTSLEWLSMMQHHGSPTRLLDWTFSPYVAVFFAINNVDLSPDSSCAVYAINYQRILAKVHLQYKEDNRFSFLSKNDYIFDGKLTEEQFQLLFFSENVSPLVLPLIPYNTHQRLTIQQGLFLCPTLTIRTKKFEDNLAATFEEVSNYKSWVKKFIIPTYLKPEIISELNYMNINDATLFPGIDGYSRFLGKKYSIENEKFWAMAIKGEI